MTNNERPTHAPRVVFPIHLPTDTHARLKRAAKMQKETLAEFMRNAAGERANAVIAAADSESETDATAESAAA